MDKSLWTKVVWLGAILAIPAAILAVQKPEAPRVAAESHRVIVLDQPVSVDISDRQIEGAKPVESAAVVDAPKPSALHIGAEKITMKGAPPSDPAIAKTETPPKDLGSLLAPVAGPGPQAAAPAQ